jgi:hypothetical protein
VIDGLDGGVGQHGHGHVVMMVGSMMTMMIQIEYNDGRYAVRVGIQNSVVIVRRGIIDMLKNIFASGGLEFVSRIAQVSRSFLSVKVGHAYLVADYDMLVPCSRLFSVLNNQNKKEKSIFFDLKDEKIGRSNFQRVFFGFSFPGGRVTNNSNK